MILGPLNEILNSEHVLGFLGAQFGTFRIQSVAKFGVMKGVIQACRGLGRGYEWMYTCRKGEMEKQKIASCGIKGHLPL